MKKLIINVLNTLFYMFFSSNFKDISKVIKKYDNISFDIFDTLIKRIVVKPEDVFDLVENEYNKINKDKIKNFRANRIVSFKKTIKVINSEEVTLDEIYENMDMYTDLQKKKLMDLEVNVELKVCKKNISMYRIYKKCLKDNKKIYITSDMYLPVDIVKKILITNGYNKYYKLYLSSDKRITKKTGHLFKSLVIENNINRKNFIHIGDSPVQDYIVPNKMGLKAILINPRVYNTYFCKRNKKNKFYDILIRYISITQDIKKTDAYYFGYEVFGPLLYGFVTWLHKEIKKANIEKVYFLARDAKIIMLSYNCLYKENIKMKYLNISRRSIILSDLYEVKSFEELYDKLKSILKKTAKLKDLLSVLNLDIKKYDLYLNKLIFELNNNEKEYIFNLIQNDIKEYSYQQQILFNKYLEQNEVDGKLAFVDIGWNGTIQYLVSKKTNNYNIIGYYFGINKDDRFSSYNCIKRKGYLFDNKAFNNNQSITALNIGVFESMFLSMEGTTLGYHIENNNVVPTLAKSNRNNKIINDIQAGAIKFIKNIYNSKLDNYFSQFDKETLFQNYKYITCNPNKKFIDIFKNIEFEGHNKKKLINSKKFTYYFFHLNEFFIDLNNSYCKIIYLKSIFKINLPYFNLLNCVYRRIKK